MYTLPRVSIKLVSAAGPPPVAKSPCARFVGRVELIAFYSLLKLNGGYKKNDTYIFFCVHS